MRPDDRRLSRVYSDGVERLGPESLFVGQVKDPAASKLENASISLRRVAHSASVIRQRTSGERPKTCAS